MLKLKSFTLIELLIAVAIVAILAAIAWPNFIAMKEKSLNREAKASLLLVRSAEENYRMKQGYYYPNGSTTNVIADINNYLRLRLPESATRSWTISLTCTAAPEFAEATRTGVGADGRKWKVNFSGDADPACTGGSYCL